MSEFAEDAMVLSVIVPARDEEDVLGSCLESLVAQSEEGFRLGQEWELIVVDDGSSDGTRTVAEGIAGVTVMVPPLLEVGKKAWFTGKTNACWAGAQAARGQLLLFTDADTVHEAGNLSRARHEMEKYDVALLTYSPRQLTTGLAQRMVMPLVFAELATAYPMKRVNDGGDRTAAANGQFLMVQRETYFAVGGHRGVGREVLEDVALARAVKRAKAGIRFRYAPDALSTRMYRTTTAMMEGWTKNLALLFPRPVAMSLLRVLDLALIVGLPLLAVQHAYYLQGYQRTLIWVLWARVLWRFYVRVWRSNFSAVDCLLAVFGIPLFCWLLVQSYLAVRVKKAVEWKGRIYGTG